MTALRLALPLVSLALSCGPAPVGAFADKPEPAEEVRLTLTGTLRMPDGSPASGATVESTDDPDESPIVARTDRRRPIPDPGRLRQWRPAARPLGGPEPPGHADHPGGRRPFDDRDSDRVDPRAGGRPRGRRPRGRTTRRGRIRRRLGIRVRRLRRHRPGWHGAIAATGRRATPGTGRLASRPGRPRRARPGRSACPGPDGALAPPAGAAPDPGRRPGGPPDRGPGARRQLLRGRFGLGRRRTRSSPPACGRTPKARRSCPGPRARD